MKKIIRYFIHITILFLLLGITSCSNFNNTEYNEMNIGFYTLVTDSYGNEHKINLDVVKDEKNYLGTFYLPGNVSSDSKLLWENEDIIILLNNKEYKSGDISIPKENELLNIVEKGNKTKFSLCTFVSSSTIEPLFINIDEEEGTIEEMNNDSKHNTSCYGHASFDNNQYPISIKGRGNTTWTDGLKKPYNITFLEEEYSGKQSVKMINDVKTSKWSLLANYSDPTLLRNRIGYLLSNKLSVGLPSRYFDVWMNGNYLGNYLITPKNDYQAKDDGFIIEIDNAIDEEDPQFNIYNDNGVIESLLFTIKNDDGEYGVDEIERITQDAWNAIENIDSESYQNYVDIESEAKMYILNEIFKNYDIVNGSIYMHKDGKAKADKLIAGPIWDLDNTMGASSYNELTNQEHSLMYVGDWYINAVNLQENNYCWYQELAKHESFISIVKEVYRKNKTDILNVKEDIKNEYELNKKSFISDFNKWGNERKSNNFYFAENTTSGEGIYKVNYNATNNYDDYYNNLCTYVNKRLEFIDSNIDNIR